MKRIMSLACAMFFTLTATAVTIDWNKDVNWGDMRWRGLNNLEDGERDIGHIKETTKAAYRVNIRFSNGVPTSGCVLMLGGTVGDIGGYGIKLSLTENGLAALLKDENHTATFTGGGEVIEGLNQIVVTVDRGVGPNYGAANSVFLNGVECLTYDGRLGGVTFKRITIGRGYEETEDPMSMKGVTFNAAIASTNDPEDCYAGSDDIRKAYDSLPEPTALALLALGLVGAALRRKVA